MSSRKLLQQTFGLTLIGLLLAGCGGGSTAKFCEAVTTAVDAQMTVEDVNDYYEQLEAAAPKEIKDDVATLREGWQQVSFPLSQATGGQVSSMSRPPEVSAAAKNVANYMVEQCGVELGEGIFLAFPEIGW
ncbi:MAG: hypothetical protein DRJ03_13925 [Chloroflexi bacterium]|nr:MAG: hypothetical protein DRJ03_13925 [Chloroflexota bacterium]